MCQDSLTTLRRLLEVPLMPLERSSRNSPTQRRTSSSEAASTMEGPPRPDSSTPWPDPTRCSLHKPELRAHISLRLILSPLVSKIKIIIISFLLVRLFSLNLVWSSKSWMPLIPLTHWLSLESLLRSPEAYSQFRP